MKMKCRIIGNSFFCSDESAEMQEKIQKSIEKLDQQTKDYSIDRLFGLIVGDVDERFILELVKLRGAKLESELAELEDQKQILNKMIDYSEKELTEARAEIERMKQERTINGIRAHCTMEDGDNEYILQRNELEAAKAEAEEWKTKYYYQNAETKKAIDKRDDYMLSSAKKDALIKQMLEALQSWNNSFESCVKGGMKVDNNFFACLNRQYIESENVLEKAKGGK